MKSDARVLAHGPRHWRQHCWFVPAIVKHHLAAAVEAQTAARCPRPIRSKERAAISMLVIKRSQRRVRSFQQNRLPAVRFRDAEIRNLAEHIAHRNIEGATLLL